MKDILEDMKGVIFVVVITLLFVSVGFIVSRLTRNNDIDNTPQPYEQSITEIKETMASQARQIEELENKIVEHEAALDFLNAMFDLKLIDMKKMQEYYEKTQ